MYFLLKMGIFRGCVNVSECNIYDSQKQATSTFLPTTAMDLRSMAVLFGRDLWLRLFTSNREVQTMGAYLAGGGHVVCEKVYDLGVHIYIV